MAARCKADFTLKLDASNLGMAGVWSGFLTFGLVTIPVRLFSGARGEKVSFHMLHARDHARLKQQMICSRDGEVVARAETVRGYEYAKGEYVVVSDEQIKAAAPHTDRHLEIIEFCRAEEIDPIWFETSYFLMPEAAGRRPHALLRQAMRDSGYVAVAQLSMHNREYLSLVRPSHLAGVPNAHARAEGLVLHTLFYLDEIRVADGFGDAGAEAAGPGELKLARQLMEGLARRFEPERFVDHYRKNLEGVVAAALEGRPSPKPAARPRLEPVTDLMAALKASLEHGGRQPGAIKRPPTRAAAETRRARRGKHAA